MGLFVLAVAPNCTPLLLERRPEAGGGRENVAHGRGMMVSRHVRTAHLVSVLVVLDGIVVGVSAHAIRGMGRTVLRAVGAFLPVAHTITSPLG